MRELDAEDLETLIADSRLEEAAGAMNVKYREVSSHVLDVFEDLLDSLVTSTFRGDLADLRNVLGAGPPSKRSRLRAFLSSPGAQNCLTAVLTVLEKEVPHSVSMGFSGVSSFFRKTDFAGTYHTDIINYEPEFSRLTDQRLVRLLSLQPNTLDIGLFDEAALHKKEQVLLAYRKESLEPLKLIFRETAERCLLFLSELEEHALALRRFYDDFEARGFPADEEILSGWSALGEEFFHLEQRKSGLMLPITPKALYWGMQGEYAETLALLSELKTMVTPEFSLSESRGDDGERVIDVECLNPQSIKGEGFLIEPRLRYTTRDMPSSESLEITAGGLASPSRYRFRLRRSGDGSLPLPLTFMVSCEARFYPQAFRTEKHFLLGD